MKENLAKYAYWVKVTMAAHKKKFSLSVCMLFIFTITFSMR